MQTWKTKIIDPIGIHARPASMIVAAASKFQSDVFLAAGEKKGNAKSVINLMALGVKTGTEVTLITDGPDEKEALVAVKAVMEKEKLV